jgi:hypothetical protein
MNQRHSKRVTAFLGACALAVSPVAASAHSTGAVDPYGCHSDRRSGNYHCHRGEYTNVTFRSKADMLNNKKAGKSGAVLRADQGRDNPAAPSILGSVLGSEEETQRTASNSELIVPKGVQKRLEILDDLHDQGLITEEEYQAKRKEILGDL